jgi:hypothetical protein
MAGKGWSCFGIPPTLSHCSPLDGGALRCLPLCAYSVGSPIPTPHPINQSVSAGRISGQSTIISGQWGRRVRQARTSYQCGRGADRETGRTEQSRQGRRDAGEQDRTADRTERDSLREPMTHDYYLSSHRPPPHPSPPRPSTGAGTATGKIPHVENFLLKSNPSSNNLLGTLLRYGTLFERGVAWTLSRYPPLYRGGRA